MEYLDKHGVRVYLTDALSRMKPDSTATSQTQFLLDYFNAVISGTNVLHRDFAYIQSTPRNRLSFVTQFSHLLTCNRQESCKPADYFHLIELMSQGFPYEVVKRAAELTEYVLGIQQQQPEKAKLGVALPSKSFVVFFRVCFYYMELVAMAEQCIVAAFEEHQRVRTNSLSPNYSHEELKTIRDSFVTLLNDDISKSSTVIQVPPARTLQTSIDRAFSAGGLRATASIGAFSTFVYLEFARSLAMLDVLE
ncbi:hypothetical protein CcCBS67573_g10706 [Chytriomyces confervae]|uniref:Centriolar satellite-associated tubulin polyglutamylase complex regulator 1 n=1 Tax=Chytriomyces confervae TaxID=246404 RepID=A0A507CL04_9FUNG|nr:hypothetical protein CcCBS67573_g10706 [Chytriomyces confervae]